MTYQKKGDGREILQQLHNRYFALRHGTSQANEQGIILSHPREGTKGYGLTPEGREQVRASVMQAVMNGVLDASTIVYSSDFIRARETAEIASEILQSDGIVETTKLRERFFGNWEKTHNSNYQKVWDDDEKDAHHKNYGVESASEVLSRTTSLIVDLESLYQGRTILLVSHGDALQILQTAFENVSPTKHWQLSPLQTAEIRELSK
jgi:glucosyl-3-phosphoglycerate phosphatase